MIVVDTTMLVYAAGSEHPLKMPSQRLFDHVAAGAVRATTIASVLQEFASVWARRRPRGDAAVRARDYLAMLGPLYRVDQRDLEDGLRLFELHASLGSFDAVLAAVTLNRDVTALVSGDRGFRDVPELRYVDPATSDLDELLQA